MKKVFMPLITGTACMFSLSLCMSGCVSPMQNPHSPVADPNQIDSNPFGSAEIKQCAKEITPKLLSSVDSGNESDKAVRIRIMPLQNNSSIRIDSRMVTDALKSELETIAGQNGEKRVMFVSGNKNVIKLSDKILKERMEKKRLEVLDQVAEDLLSSPVLKSSGKIPVVAVTPVVNSNFVNLNGNAFVSLLRGRIARKAQGKVQFTAPGTMAGADYYLSGEFIAESMKTEGMVNLVDYITLMEDRLKAGKTMDVMAEIPMESRTTELSKFSEVRTTLSYDRYRSLLSELSRASSLRVEPDVNKHLNVMLVKADTKVSVYENMFLLDMKTNDRLANADLVLTGEISSMSSRGQGGEMCYVVVTFHLVDPESGDEVWTGRFETKRKTQMDRVYY